MTLPLRLVLAVLLVGLYCLLVIVHRSQDRAVRTGAAMWIGTVGGLIGVVVTIMYTWD